MACMKSSIYLPQHLPIIFLSEPPKIFYYYNPQLWRHYCIASPSRRKPWLASTLRVCPKTDSDYLVKAGYCWRTVRTYVLRRPLHTLINRPTILVDHGMCGVWVFGAYVFSFGIRCWFDELREGRWTGLLVESPMSRLCSMGDSDFGVVGIGGVQLVV